MVPLRFICVLLVLVLLHLRDSRAHTLQDAKKSVATPGSDQLEARGRNSVNVEKMVYDGVPTGAEIEITGLGGRKMMLKRGLLKEMMKEEAFNPEDSKSGKDIYALNKQLAGNSQKDAKDHQQDDRSTLKTNSLKSASLQSVILSRIGQLNSQYSKLVSSGLGGSAASSGKLVLQESGDFQNLESRKLLDAAGELVQLMGKDYEGHGGPRHNPPINNDRPLNNYEEHVVP